MEPSFFKEVPKFKTPDEELQYLRAHVSRREQELRDSGHLEAGDTAARDVLGAYRQIPAEEAVHKDSLLGKKETEGIVLRLKPESHDSVMEELLGIVITRGIKNATAVVEKMNNHHIDDDFHRLLVQFLKTGQHIRDLKEKTPLDKSLRMTLFEV